MVRWAFSIHRECCCMHCKTKTASPVAYGLPLYGFRFSRAACGSQFSPTGENAPGRAHDTDRRAVYKCATYVVKKAGLPPLAYAVAPCVFAGF